MVNEQLVRVAVKGIALEQETRLPILLLRCFDDSRVVPVPIGPAEASSIIIEIEGITPPRPLTHDLIAELFRRHRLRPRRLEIYGMIQEKHLARVVYTKGLKSHSLEVRPSDGVALALRLDIPVFADRAIVEQPATTLSAIDLFDQDSAEVLYLVSPNGAHAAGP